MTTPVGTTGAIAELVRALERIGQVDNDTGSADDDVCCECDGWVAMADEPVDGRPSCGTDCPGRSARAALRAWHERRPLREIGRAHV